MSQPLIAIFPSPSGQQEALATSLNQLGARALVSTQPQQILDADGLILPPVSSLLELKQELAKVQGLGLIGRRVAGSRPVLALGRSMHLLFDQVQGMGQEPALEGMGEWPGVIETLTRGQAQQTLGLEVASGSQLFAGLEKLPASQAQFQVDSRQGLVNWTFDQNNEAMLPPQVTWSSGSPRLALAIENGPLVASQADLLASGEAGQLVLSNWLASLPVTGRL